MDVDLICEMLEAQMPEFLARIDDRFYVLRNRMARDE